MNPLLTVLRAEQPFGALNAAALPQFADIKAEHVVPAVDACLQKCRATLAEVIASHENQTPTWQSLIMPLALVDDELERVFSPVSHLNAVLHSAPLLAAYNECLPKLTRYASEVGQNARLYALTKALIASDEYAQLSQAQQKTLQNHLLDFELAGVGLDAAQQQRYQQISERLSTLASTFSQNVLSATDAWQLHLKDASRLGGLPPSALAMLQQNAQAQNLDGYLINLQIPCYLAVMTYADERALREEIYRAYVTRASAESANPQWDNSALIEEILALRHELAQLLGFEDYAHKSLATKMAQSPQQVVDFLEDLLNKSHGAAAREFKELRDFASKEGIGTLEAWDSAYYSEKLQQQQFDIDQEQLRPWFAADKVVQGLFDIVHKLYQINISQLDGVAVYHPDVQFYQIKDSQQQLLGGFYLDLYARANKRGGAWMDVCTSRFDKNGTLQYPLAYLTCNATPPIGEAPALFSHDEVITLFHEFGHGLHHMLSKIGVPAVSGISGVEWDAVELPSQFMENWAWQQSALALFARHYQSQQPLPEELFNKLFAAKNFQAGMQMLRQIEFALFDFYLHWQYDPAGDIGSRCQNLLAKIRARTAMIKPPAFNRFENSFSHIFAGGYAAGYYSYKWAEVLSSDAFAEFEKNGIFDAATGKRFLEEILQVGGARPALESFVAFCQRQPDTQALLRHSGLAS